MVITPLPSPLSWCLVTLALTLAPFFALAVHAPHQARGYIDVVKKARAAKPPSRSTAPVDREIGPGPGGAGDAIKARIAQLSTARRAYLERKGIDLEAYCIEEEKVLAERAVGNEQASKELTEAELQHLSELERWIDAARGGQGWALDRLPSMVKLIRDEQIACFLDQLERLHKRIHAPPAAWQDKFNKQSLAGLRAYDERLGDLKWSRVKKDLTSLPPDDLKRSKGGSGNIGFFRTAAAIACSVGAFDSDPKEELKWERRFRDLRKKTSPVKG